MQAGGTGGEKVRRDGGCEAREEGGEMEPGTLGDKGDCISKRQSLIPLPTRLPPHV